MITKTAFKTPFCLSLNQSRKKCNFTELTVVSVKLTVKHSAATKTRLYLFSLRPPVVQLCQKMKIRQNSSLCFCLYTALEAAA